ncbi:MAG: hypothetical protein JWO94_3969 [Verrucomicrobiaceae bacterium]|nr:hypothetical protein [Verrucomicrobiaceae bacterium]
MSAFISWIVLGTPWRSIGRLVNEKVVTSRDSVELLWSSGWLRQNTNVYRCPKARLCMPLITHAPFRESTVAELVETAISPNTDVQALLNRHVPTAIDWKNVKVYSGEGDVLITLITVVLPEKGSDAFIYMDVF